MNNIPTDPPLWRAAEPTLNNKPVVDFNDEADRMWTSYNFNYGSQIPAGEMRDTAIGVARYTGQRNGESERLISSNGGTTSSVFIANRQTVTTSMAG